MERRILVTGGAGFIGSNIVDFLVDKGFRVSVVDDLSTGKAENLNPKATFYRCDIGSDQLQVVLATEKPDCVIHHAAQIDVRRSLANPVLDARVNIGGSINVLDACRNSGVRKVIYASSAAVYGTPSCLPVGEEHPINPSSPYGITKHTVEHYLTTYRALYGLEYTVLRYANVYGPRQDPLGEGGVVAIFLDKVLSGKQCTIYGDGNQTRDFVYVRDVAQANLLAIDRGNGLVLNVGCEREISINDLLRTLHACVGGRLCAPEYAPGRPGEVDRSVLANKRAWQALGWKPNYDLFAGLSHMLAHLNSQHPVHATQE